MTDKTSTAPVMSLKQVRDLLEGVQTSGNLSRVSLHVTRVRQAIRSLDHHLTAPPPDVVGGDVVAKARDLIKRLRDTPNWLKEPWGDFKSAGANTFDRAPKEAADLIEVLVAAPRVQGDAEPDPQLCAWYGVSTWAGLVAAQEEHVLKLQDAARRNVKPWEDTSPPTLLPKYLRDTGLIDADQVSGYEVTAPSVGYWTVVKKRLQADSIAEDHRAGGVTDTEIVRLYATQPKVDDLSDEAIIAACKRAGIRWIEPGTDSDGDDFPRRFDMATMAEMRALLSALSHPAEQTRGDASPFLIPELVKLGPGSRPRVKPEISNDPRIARLVEMAFLERDLGITPGAGELQFMNYVNDKTYVQEGPAKGLNSVGWSRASGIMGTTDDAHSTGPYERVLAAAIRGYLGFDDPWDVNSTHPEATFDRTIETPRRKQAVEKMLELGWTYHHENGWTTAPQQAVPDGWPMDVHVALANLSQRLSEAAPSLPRPSWISAHKAEFWTAGIESAMARFYAEVEVLDHECRKLQKAAISAAPSAGQMGVDRG